MVGMTDIRAAHPGWVTVAAYENVDGRPHPLAAVRV
jgi:hypothetical protein